jgi:hypothetical protein
MPASHNSEALVCVSVWGTYHTAGRRVRSDHEPHPLHGAIIADPEGFILLKSQALVIS